MKGILYFLVLLIGWLIPECGLSQRTVPAITGYFGKEKLVIKLDPLSDIPEKEFPYDRWFYIRRYYKAGDPPARAVFVTNRISFTTTTLTGLAALGPKIESVDFFDAQSDVKESQPKYTKAIDILVPPLDPRSHYDLAFIYPMSNERCEKIADAFINLHEGRGAQAQDTINAINKEKTANFDYYRIDFGDFDLYYHRTVQALLTTGVNAGTRNTLIASLKNGGASVPTVGGTKQMFLDMEILSVSGTESFKLETRAAAKIQPDFGAVLYGFGGRGEAGVNSDFFGVVPYVGITYLVRSFDADIPMRYIKDRVTPFDRLSFHAGVTLFSLAKEKYRQNLFNSNNLMVGLGYRLSSVVKVQGGAIFYRKQDPNPLYNQTSIARIGYIGLSVDLRIREVLKDVGKFLFGA